MLNFEVLQNGNLKISLEESGWDYLYERLNGKTESGYEFDLDHISMWYDLSEHERCNGGYQLTDSEEIGGLTSSPMFAVDVDRYSDGRIELLPQSKVWWFPEYETVDEFKELLEKGFVTFTLATE